MGALAHLLKVGVVLVRRDLEVDHASRRALEIMGSPDQGAFMAWWDGLRPTVREAVNGAPGLDGSWSVWLELPRKEAGSKPNFIGWRVRTATIT